MRHFSQKAVPYARLPIIFIEYSLGMNSGMAGCNFFVPGKGKSPNVYFLFSFSPAMGMGSFADVGREEPTAFSMDSTFLGVSRSTSITALM